MDTTNILFICGGTFSGIEEDIAKRIGSKGSIGFTSPARSDSDRPTCCATSARKT